MSLLESASNGGGNNGGNGGAAESAADILEAAMEKAEAASGAGGQAEAAGSGNGGSGAGAGSGNGAEAGNGGSGAGNGGSGAGSTMVDLKTVDAEEIADILRANNINSDLMSIIEFARKELGAATKTELEVVQGGEVVGVTENADAKAEAAREAAEASANGGAAGSGAVSKHQTLLHKYLCSSLFPEKEDKSWSPLSVPNCQNETPLPSQVLCPDCFLNSCCSTSCHLLGIISSMRLKVSTKASTRF